ncbi:hypothetical protein [Nocardia vaccinii]|uniref:hypothetical protein n=1 Tax=Nocardia vaccinii TaxID=1822 RepID=UPI0012F4A20B|nr:hypothetical protein [Nocardia vaccinii]
MRATRSAPKVHRTGPEAPAEGRRLVGSRAAMVMLTLHAEFWTESPALGLWPGAGALDRHRVSGGRDHE